MDLQRSWTVTDLREKIEEITGEEVSEARLYRLVDQGRVKGAVKIHNRVFIPPYPEIERQGNPSRLGAVTRYIDWRDEATEEQLAG